MDLDEMLQLIADRTASLIRSPLVSVRLLDATRTRLVATCRTGASLHKNRDWGYRLGEGLVGWIAQECQPLRLSDAEKDPRFLQREDKERPVGSFLGVPIVSQGQCSGVLSAAHPSFDYFTEEHEKQLTLLAALIAPRVEPGRRERIAQLDTLTGALNAKGLDRALPEVVDEDPVSRALSIVLVDVDDVARFDDATADRALQHVASLLHDTIREEDMLARWGERQLLVLLGGATRSVAERVAERARALVEGTPLAPDELALTISAGVTQRNPSEHRDALIARATDALESARAAGKNRIAPA
jgi:diguanylate cyclase (GGDEF)-like protein